MGVPEVINFWFQCIATNQGENVHAWLGPECYTYHIASSYTVKTEVC